VIWVLYVFLIGTEVEELVYFDSLDTCLEYSSRIREQDVHQRVAGDKLYIKTFCIPKKEK
jgi:hypothetical protein